MALRREDPFCAASIAGTGPRFGLPAGWERLNEDPNGSQTEAQAEEAVFAAEARAAVATGTAVLRLRPEGSHALRCKRAQGRRTERSAAMVHALGAMFKSIGETVFYESASGVVGLKRHFHCWLADAKRVTFEPLYARERAKVKHHFPGTACEPLVFSSLGGHTRATIRRLPRGGARKEAAGVQSRTRQNGFQQVYKALLFSVISRFDAFQLSSSVLSAARVAAPPAPAAEQQRVATVAAAAAQASPPLTAASRGDVASDAGSIGSEHVQQ